MSALAFALALFATQASAETPPEAAPAPAEAPYPVGAPREDYQFVAWCYGSLRGYLDLHDQVMPEVTRIETTWRRPGSSLAEDLKIYADLQREGQKNLKQFQRAMTAAEKASMKPINALGAESVAKGRKIWAGAPTVSNARLAQEWMSWTLPARCGTTARELEQRAVLAGPAFQVNVEPETAALETATTPAPEASPLAEAPAAPQSVDEILGQPPESAPDLAAGASADEPARP